MPEKIGHNEPPNAVIIDREELKRLIDYHCDVRLSSFGIDWQSTDGKREFIEDMLFLRRLRYSIMRAHRAGLVALITTAVGAIAGLIWLGLKSKAP